MPLPLTDFWKSAACVAGGRSTFGAATWEERFL